MTQDNDARDFTFGVEIECSVPRTAGIAVGRYHYGTAVTGANLPDGTRALAPQGWKCESDASVETFRAGHTAVEFVSPVLRGDAGVDNLIAMVNWLNAVGARVNRSMGVHVHVGVASVIGRDATTETVCDYLAAVSAQTVTWGTALFAQTGTKSRENGRWCAKLDGEAEKERFTHVKRERDSYTKERRARGRDRYRSLNLMNVFGRKHTIEVRVFAATLNVDKIVHHLSTVLAIASKAKDAKRNRWAETKGHGPRTLGDGSRALRMFWLRMGWVKSGADETPGKAYGLFGKLYDHNKIARGKAATMAKKYDADV